MAATPTRVYPLRGVFAPGVPHRVHELPSIKAAEVLLATGAFTDDPQHADRIPDDEIPGAVDEPETTSEVEALKAAGGEVAEGELERLVARASEVPEPTIEERTRPEPAEPAESAEDVAADAARED